MKPHLKFLSMVIACILAAIACSSVSGQTGTAFLLDLGNGKLVGMVTTTDGQTIFISDVTVFKIPSPQPPLSQIQSAMIVYESGEQTQEQNQVQILIRMDPQLSSKIKLILDKDTTLPDGQPIPQLASALQFIGSQPLPRLVGFNSSGKAVVSEPVPQTIQGVTQIIWRWMP